MGFFSGWHPHCCERASLTHRSCSTHVSRTPHPWGWCEIHSPLWLFSSSLGQTLSPRHKTTLTLNSLGWDTSTQGHAARWSSACVTDFPTVQGWGRSSRLPHVTHGRKPSLPLQESDRTSWMSEILFVSPHPGVRVSHSLIPLTHSSLSWPPGTEFQHPQIGHHPFGGTSPSQAPENSLPFLSSKSQ